MTIQLLERDPEQARVPFKSKRRLAATFNQGEEGLQAHVKSAAEAVLPLCTDADDLQAQVDDLSGHGFRVLALALVEGKVAAAGLDVLPEEPVVREEAELLRSVYESRHDLNNLLAGQVLIHLRNVVVTPHNAFNTREAVERILETTVDNLAAYADGRPRNIAA